MIRVSVVGLGTMGPGIAATLARGGMSVSAYDIDPAAVDRGSDGVEIANKVLDALGKVDGSQGDIELTSDLAACVTDSGLVIETIPEDINLKLNLFRQLESLVSKECVLASDSSGIPVSKLQEGSVNPERFVGMHWSNPPHIIPMIEVIAGSQTSQKVVDWMVASIRGLDLIPVVVKKDIPGFVENRVLYALLRECIDLVEQEVIDPVDLDTCVSWGIGYKLAVIGPMALLDMAGLDIYQAVGSYLNQELCGRTDVSDLIKKATGSGNLGMKTGQGIFKYSAEDIGKLRKQRGESLVAVRKALDSVVVPSSND